MKTLAVLFSMLMLLCGLPQSAAARSEGHEASDDIKAARERKASSKPKSVPKAVPLRQANLADSGKAEFAAPLADAQNALARAAGAIGLVQSGSVPIPEGELQRMRVGQTQVHRFWLCTEVEPPLGPCAISVTLRSAPVDDGLTILTYRVWQWSDASASAQASDDIDALVAHMQQNL